MQSTRASSWPWEGAEQGGKRAVTLVLNFSLTRLGATARKGEQGQEKEELELEDWMR